ncbi:hypothetical protein KKF91_09685 [Myxococcota bacterium]|nr:hypothetical protein [Myxococcota bacterium]MBU1430813.1 hypothetical protein [Myxococcota bacterium]MBU1899661.1 hypothetical protein [Myxococcota bacterium]
MPILFGLVTLCAFSACGATCAQIEAARAAQLQPQEEAPDPHLVIDLPAALLEARLTAALAQVEPARLSLRLDKLGINLDALRLQAKAVKLLKGAPDALRFALIFTVSEGDAALFDLTVEAALEPQLEGQAIAFELGPRQLLKARPAISGGAAGRIQKRLGGAAKRLPTRALRALINQGLTALADEALPLLRDQILARAVKTTRVRLALPAALPLKRLALSTPRGRTGLSLRLALWTTLPVSQGVRPAPPRSTLTAWLSGPTVAALGSWALRQGALPGMEGQAPTRFNLKGQPDPQGPFEASLRWIVGADRPLKVEAWRLGGDCVHATLGARPALSLEGEGAAKLRLQALDVQLEAVEGDALVSLGAFVASLWSGAFEISKAITASMDLEIASTPLRLSLKEATLKDALIELTFDLTPQDQEPQP